MGLYGQLETVTYNIIEAFGNSTSTMMGMALTMDGQEVNVMIYDTLLDQAWSSTPLKSQESFESWATSRYQGVPLPEGLYSAWDTIRQTVYNNTDLETADSVSRSIFELSPSTAGLARRDWPSLNRDHVPL